jgi:hypothetical protein
LFTNVKFYVFPDNLNRIDFVADDRASAMYTVLEIIFQYCSQKEDILEDVVREFITGPALDILDQGLLLNWNIDDRILIVVWSDNIAGDKFSRICVQDLKKENLLRELILYETS